MHDRKRQDKQDIWNYPAYPAACDHAYPVIGLGFDDVWFELFSYLLSAKSMNPFKISTCVNFTVK